MAKEITVFTRDTCASCATIKKWLALKGFDYKLVNLDQEPQYESEVFALSGVRTVPVTIVTKENDMKEVVVGPNFARLASATA